jgi:glyoxylase-like metal-dependent hydrolase (beta-lactamase superfamily II)
MTAASEGTSEETYEVYALRYASRPTRKATEYYGYARYGDPDGPCALDYYFWLARNADRTVLIDCGYSTERARERGRYLNNDPNTDPIEVLALLGIEPDDVDHVIISHMHPDHIGNLDRFSQATFSIAREEYEFCTGAYARKPLIADLVDPVVVGVVKEFEADERLSLVDGSEQLFPGIRVTRLGGHSPGQMITEVSAKSGQVILASDATHFYEEMELDRPFWFFFDLEATYRGYEKLRELAAQPGASLVPGHDPAVMERFALREEGSVADLTAPIGGPSGA